jgi:hypothetical protein
MKNFKMELLNSEEMNGIVGGQVLACNPASKVIACQTLEGSCPGRVTYTGCGGSQFGVRCVPTFNLICIENKIVREGISIAAVSLSSYNAVSAPMDAFSAALF